MIMKLNPNQIPYDFSITSDGKIEYVHLYDKQNTKSDVMLFLQGLLDDNELVVGDGCEGDIDIHEERIRIVYCWVSLVGMNWLTGQLIRERLVFPNV